MTQYILIMGGGIAGPALALFLHKAGIRSTLFEAYPEVEDIGGGMQIAPNGMHVLKELGLAEEVITSGVESDEFRFENQHGRTLGRMRNGPASKYGSPAVFVARSVVHRALVNEAERCGIPVVYQKRLQRLTCHDSEVTAVFEDGSAQAGSLLIGADGLHSRTRELIFPQGPHPVYTGLFTIGGFASHPCLIPRTRSDMNRAHMIFGRDGFFAYGHCDRQNPDKVMWWSHISRDQGPDAREYKLWRTEELRKELLARHWGWEEPVATILQSAPELLWGPVYDVPSLPAWSKERVLLIGDAAHATSPHAGMGASLALEDAMSLAKLLRDSRAGHEQVFEGFIDERRKRVERIIAEGRARGDRKKTLSATAAWIRNRGISLLMRLRGDRMNDWMYSYKTTWED